MIGGRGCQNLKVAPCALLGQVVRRATGAPEPGKPCLNPLSNYKEGLQRGYGNSWNGRESGTLSGTRGPSPAEKQLRRASGGPLLTNIVPSPLIMSDKTTGAHTSHEHNFTFYKMAGVPYMFREDDLHVRRGHFPGDVHARPP